MKIKVLSDLHMEFGNGFMMDEFFSGDVDMFIVAGDISDSRLIRQHLRKIDHCVTVPVIFITGNHEYYHSQKSYIDSEIDSMTFKHIMFLNNRIYKQDGVIFIGSTGWFDSMMLPHHIRTLNDFRLIHDIKFANNGTDWGRESKDFFYDQLKSIKNSKVVCISHNLPSWECINPLYKDSPINACFANHYDYMIKEFQPEYWICGHTHSSVDINIGKTRIIANPFGYWRQDENPDFNNNLIIEV